MSTPDPESSAREPMLTTSDIYRAAREGVLRQEEASRLVSWAYNEQTNSGATAADGDSSSPTDSKRINRQSVASYMGALLMIAATNWLLGTKWEGLESTSVLTISMLYATSAARWGNRLRSQGHTLQGGLLLTVAVSQVPIITYSLQDIFHLWPGGQPLLPYMFFHLMAHPSWVVMELATIAISLLALRYVRFPFLAAPLGYSCLMLSRDLPLWVAGYSRVDFGKHLWASVGVGLLTILIGSRLNRQGGHEQLPRSEDPAFWPYLFGTFAVWSGLSALTNLQMMHVSALLLFSLGLIVVGVRTRRKTFLVFGGLGVDGSLLQLAHLNFRDSLFFPFIVVAAGACLLNARAFRTQTVKERLD